jgi:hypothetical protein
MSENKNYELEDLSFICCECGDRILYPTGIFKSCEGGADIEENQLCHVCYDQICKQCQTGDEVFERSLSE